MMKVNVEADQFPNMDGRTLFASGRVRKRQRLCLER
jgi:hypothetical protein